MLEKLIHLSSDQLVRKHEKWECASDHGVSHICILDENIYH